MNCHLGVCDGFLLKYASMVSHLSMPEYAFTLCWTPGKAVVVPDVFENRSAKEPWRRNDPPPDSLVPVLLRWAIVDKVLRIPA